MGDNNTTCDNHFGVGKEFYEEVTKQLYLYASPPLVILGTIGNVLSLVVMHQKALRKLTTPLYLTVLAFVDILLLYTGLLPIWVSIVSGTDIQRLSPVTCKIHIFLGFLLMQYEGWILVWVCIERLGAVFLLKKTVFTRRAAMIQLAITLCLLFIFNIHLFWTFNLSGNPKCLKCEKVPQYEWFLESLWAWLDFCLASLLPFCIMLGCNTFIIMRLICKNNKLPVRSASEAARITHRKCRLARMTAVLLTVSVIFFLTTGPHAFFMSTKSKWFPMLPSISNEDVLREGMWTYTLNLLAYVNNAVNFVLYCLSSPRFRHEFLRVLGKKLGHIPLLSRLQRLSMTAEHDGQIPLNDPNGQHLNVPITTVNTTVTCHKHSQDPIGIADTQVMCCQNGHEDPTVEKQSDLDFV